MLNDNDIAARAISNKRFFSGNEIYPQAFHYPDDQMGQPLCELSFIKKNYFIDKEDFWNICDIYIWHNHKKTLASADIIAKDIKDIQMPTFFDLDNSFKGHCCLKINLELSLLARKLALLAKLDIR